MCGVCVCLSPILIFFLLCGYVFERDGERGENFWKCLMNIFLSNYLIDYTEEICLLPAESRAEVEHININIYGVITCFDLWLTGVIYLYNSQHHIYLFLLLSLYCVLVSFTRHCTESHTILKVSQSSWKYASRSWSWEVINSSVCSVNYLLIWFFTKIARDIQRVN